MNNNNSHPKVPMALFNKMQISLENSGASFAHSLRLAKTLAPVLQDQSSNEKHLALLLDPKAPLKDRVISVIMLGFPKNRRFLPVLRKVLAEECESLKIAAAIAISQMRDGENNQVLAGILLEAFSAHDSKELKKTIKQALLCLMDKHSAEITQTLLNDSL